MKTKMILLLTTLTTVLAACNKTSSGAGADASVAANSASNSLTVMPMITNPTVGQTITISVTGGSGVYTTMSANQGATPTQTGSNTWTYVVPSTFTMPQVTFTAYDSAGLTGVGYIAIQGTSTGTTTTVTQSSSCAGTYSAQFNTLTGQLYVVQNSSNQIGGYIYFNDSKYYQPIFGTCSSGTISFVDVSGQQQYTASITNSGGQLLLQGSINGNIPFRATMQSTIAAASTETIACGGTYTGTFGPNQGQLRLVHNGSGTLAGSLVIGTNIYAMTGTCGGTITLRNMVHGTAWTGTLSGNLMTGTYFTNGQTYSFSASK